MQCLVPRPTILIPLFERCFAAFSSDKSAPWAPTDMQQSASALSPSLSLSNCLTQSDPPLSLSLSEAPPLLLLTWRPSLLVKFQRTLYNVHFHLNRQLLDQSANCLCVFFSGCFWYLFNITTMVMKYLTYSLTICAYMCLTKTKRVLKYQSNGCSKVNPFCSAVTLKLDRSRPHRTWLAIYLKMKMLHRERERERELWTGKLGY